MTRNESKGSGIGAIAPIRYDRLPAGLGYAPPLLLSFLLIFLFNAAYAQSAPGTCTNWECVSGQCMPSVACTDDSGCTPPTRCISGFCSLSTSCPDTPCPSGSTCAFDGSCIPVTHCVNDSECPVPADTCRGGGCIVAMTCPDVPCWGGLTCAPDGNCVSPQACLADNECPAPMDRCLNGFCTLVTTCPDTPCPSGAVCAIDGSCLPTTTCGTDSECVSAGVGNTCRGGYCVSVEFIGCSPTNPCQTGTVCSAEGKCVVVLSGCDPACPEGTSCMGGSCVQTKLGDRPVVFIQAGEGGGGGGRETKFVPIEIVTEQIRGATAPIIFALFNISTKKLRATSTCIRGARCASSSDCCGAECVGGACICSMTACLTTSDCCIGYCQGGKCRLPPSASLFLFNALNRKMDAQLGCAGLIEECAPDETNCISICNGLSFLLMLVAGGFGAYSWRLFKHPAAGLLAAFTPVAIGLVTYPFVGIIMGIILFTMLLSKS